MRKIALLLALFPILFASQVRADQTADKLDIIIKNQKAIIESQEFISKQIQSIYKRLFTMPYISIDSKIEELTTKINNLQSTINRKLGY